MSRCHIPISAWRAYLSSVDGNNACGCVPLSGPGDGTGSVLRSDRLSAHHVGAEVSSAHTHIPCDHCRVVRQLHMSHISDASSRGYTTQAGHTSALRRWHRPERLRLSLPQVRLLPLLLLLALLALHPLLLQCCHAVQELRALAAGPVGCDGLRSREASGCLRRSEPDTAASPEWRWTVHRRRESDEVECREERRRAEGEGRRWTCG